jgi:RNA polymerase sigma-70 factor (ECF subfamily)
MTYTMSLKGMMSESTEGLIQRARTGDVSAYQKCIQIYSSRVHAIAYQVVGNSIDAQDIAQEVFIRLFNSFHTYKHGYSFTTWLYRLTINLSIDHFRKNIRHQNISLDDVSDDSCMKSNDHLPDRNFEQTQLKGAIHRISEGLTIKQRKVFVLRELQGFSTPEVAQILKCRQSTVRAHLFKARKQIKEALEKHGFEKRSRLPDHEEE